MTEPDDTVQPDAGQGEPVADAPYAEYLNRIPEELRGQVEPIFKEWDGNTTRKFQEASEYRKGWEPYEQVGVNRHDPAAVEWALQFYSALENPKAIKDWYGDYQQQHPELQEQQAVQQQQSPDAFEFQDPSVQAYEEKMKALLAPMQQELDANRQWRETQAQQTREQDALRYIEGQIGELKEKHGAEFNEQAVEQLIPQYIETDPRNAVQRAWADYQSLVNQIQKDVLQSKVKQPAAAESGGLPDVAPEEVKTMSRAGEITREILRNARMA
jgi:hypothetical protein